MGELRCENKLHGIVVEDHVVEVKCDSRYCGAAPGTTVLHRFDVRTGEVIETLRFRSPERRTSASQHHPAAVRSA